MISHYHLTALFIAFSLPHSLVAQALPVFAQSTELSTFELAPLLRNGGYLLVMRHERTVLEPATDDYSKPITECRSQRNLSLAGIAGAAETGAAIKQLSIPVGRVLASPMCRTMETAPLAFSGAEAAQLLVHHNNVRGRDGKVAGTEMRLLAATLDPGVSNIVLISHYTNIAADLGPKLDEGEIAVMRKDVTGFWVPMGQAPGSESNKAARNILMPPTSSTQGEAK